MDELRTLLLTPGVGLMPHGMCLAWQPGVLWLNVATDALIAVAYLSIPFALTTFVRNRPDLEFRWAFQLFAAFIFLCAITHLMAVWVVWNPNFTAQGLVKMLTAIVSVLTAWALWSLIPKALALPSPSTLRQTNSELERIKQELEERVADRTRELEQIRALLQTIIESVSAEVTYFDSASRLRIWNKLYAQRMVDAGCAQLLSAGQLREDIVRGRLAASTGITAARLDQLVSEILAHHSQPEGEIEFELDGRDMLMREQRTEAGGSVVTVVDVSHLKATERRLAERTSQLERSNEELDAFAHIASHDLKEPLRGMHNYATFLIEDYSDKLDDAGVSMLETLVDLTAHLDRLLNSLLRFSQVGRVDLAVGEVNLDVVVNDVLDSLKASLEADNVEVRISRPLPTVVCDSVRIGEVFRNLIVNALKYNDKNHKWIELGVLNNEATNEINNASAFDSASNVFFVRDNGIGIAKRHFENVFRIFKRLHGRDKFGGGTGVGLTIVKRIIERHGGRIWVKSKAHEGATFFFTLAA